MSQEANMSVEETQEAVAPATETTEHNDVSKEAQDAEQRKRNDAEYNWAEMRRAREKDREEIEALRKELESIKPQNSPPLPEDDFGISDDDLAEGRHLRKLKKELKELKSELQKKEMSSMEERLHMRFTDYDDVVSRENIEIAKKLEPELAQSIAGIADPYQQGIAAYKFLKRVAVKQDDSSAFEKKKALENSQKPLSVNAVTKQSAIGNAHLFENGLTKELKSQLWKEMQEAMKSG